MDFGWTPEQQALREQVAAFARSELNEGLAEADAANGFRRDAWQKCADFGILKCNIPRAYGGLERDITTSVAMLEALGHGCRDNGLLLGINSQLWTVQQPILTYGNEEQKQRYLPRLGSGEIIAADAVTEPDAGSDALAMATTATRRSAGYVLNGRKSTVGQAPLADLFLVFAKTNVAAGSWGISVFLIDRDTPGLRRSRNREKMGTRTLAMGDLVFEDCFVPEAARLGPEGVGASFFNRSAEWERCFILASYVGTMARQLDEAIAHAKERRQFGRPIAEFQAVSHRIADMHVRLELARLLLYKAAWLKQRDESCALHAAVTKLFTSEAFLESSLDAVRTFGAKGYLAEFGVERDLRDAVGPLIYAGTSDIQRNLIARLLGL